VGSKKFGLFVGLVGLVFPIYLSASVMIVMFHSFYISRACCM
jgi:hypothetical protein